MNNVFVLVRIVTVPYVRTTLVGGGILSIKSPATFTSTPCPP